MRILVLGGRGMLGHKVWEILSNSMDVYATIRGSFDDLEELGSFDKNKIISGIDALDFSLLERKIEELSPDVVLNCIGIVKQIEDAEDAIKSIEINSLFPHRLSSLCARINSRLMHLSTDCVFSGKKGNYTETDTSDPVDLYGRTKLLGEVQEGNVLTIRTSMIGRELKTQHGLLAWFLNQEGKTVEGYSKAIFSGFPTVVLSKIIKDIILNYPGLKGIYHVSSLPISKFDLLTLIKRKMGLDINIIKNTKVFCDRSLNHSKFSWECNYNPPSWEIMVDELVYEMRGDKI